MTSARPDAVYGAALDGEQVVEVPMHLAGLFARAHELVFQRAAGVHLGDGVVSVSDHAGPGGGWSIPPDELVERVRRARRPLVLAGRGVIRAGALPGLHALAAVAHLGVLNTWEAKGVFDWRSRHHLATAGLQERDYRLAGLGDADLIVATGIDAGDSDAWRWRLAEVVEIDPSMLDPLSERWFRDPTPIEMPPLRTLLAAATQAGWVETGLPIAPSLVTRNYGSVIGEAGLLAADAGTSGFWVARTYSTTGLGTVVVAPTPMPGLAVACAAVARLRNPHRLVLATVDGPLTDAVGEVLDAAASAGAAVGVEAWHVDGETLSAEAHAQRAAALGRCSTPTVVTLATDPAQLAVMVDAAGPVVAWPALAAPTTM